MKYRYSLIVGGTSGIGLELVKKLAAQGTKIAVVGRNFESIQKLPEGIQACIRQYPRDVREDENLDEFIAKVAQDIGGLDLMIYSSGIMIDRPIDVFDTKADQEIIDVNYRSAVAWINATAIRFQAVKAGTIVAIGSVAGDRGRRDRPAYNSSKAALHTYMEALRNRLWKDGVIVVTIKPGPVSTPMLKDQNYPQMISADVAADKILKKINSSGEHYLIFSQKVIFNVIKIIPSWVFRHIKI